MPTITIAAQPANPLQYLGCCGIFEIASRFDPAAFAAWQVTKPVALHIESTLTEDDLAGIIVDAFTKPERWQMQTLRDQTDVWRCDLQLRFNNVCTTIPLDWWHETLKADGSIDNKSAWKMYAGQQTFEKITADMTESCAELIKGSLRPTSLSKLLDSNCGMTGRFGFDPRSTRSALDVGYSPNDLGLPVATYPFAELLSTIGLQTFFPGRCGIVGRLPSTRGWTREPADAFLYRLWTDSMPIVLARIAAATSAIGPAVELSAPRANRKNYSNLTLAQTR